jgi:hypothetical protein
MENKLKDMDLYKLDKFFSSVEVYYHKAFQAPVDSITSFTHTEQWLVMVNLHSRIKLKLQ